jgi:hypothetical protein
MWYRNIKIADQGVYIPYGPGGVNLLDMLYNFCNQSVETLASGTKKIDIVKLNSLIKNSYLANFISKVVLEPDEAKLYGTYNRLSKIMTINNNYTKRDLENIISTLGHETVHSVKPLDEAEQRSKIKAGRKQYELFYGYKNLENEKNVEWQKIIDKFQNGIIDRNQRFKEFQDLEAKYSKKFKNLEKQYSYKPFYASGTDKGRIPYFFNEEILAQTIDIKNTFRLDVLNYVYETRYLPYNKDAKTFVSDLRSLIAEFDKIQKTADMIYNDPQILASLKPENIIQKYSLGPEVQIKYQQGDQNTLAMIGDYIDFEKKQFLEKNVPKYRLLKDIENASGQEFIWKLLNIKDPVYFEHIKKSLSNDLLAIEQKLGLKAVHTPLRSETPQAKKQNVKVDNSSAVSQQTSQQTTPKSVAPPEKAPDTKQQTKAPKKPLTSDEISKKTSSLPDVNKPSTPKSTSALSKILPTIKKLFTELSALLEKFNRSTPGRIFNYAMLAKDIYFVITLTNKIAEQIKNNEEVMLKDQLDLGLTIVSLLTDQQTQAILRTVYPPISVLLNNPQVQGWLLGINIGANVYMGVVSLTDYLGTLSGTSNKSQGASAGLQNVPGGAQALVMPVFQLFDKYGEVYNALIDNEKGIKTEQAIAKHIMKDASSGLEPYRLSLFYKFRENKDKILAYQKSPAFKKLPVGNQILYPNANSAYAISSYKKAKDAQKKARQDAYNRNFPSSSGGGGRALPVQ